MPAQALSTEKLRLLGESDSCWPLKLMDSIFVPHAPAANALMRLLRQTDLLAGTPLSFAGWLVVLSLLYILELKAKPRPAANFSLGAIRPNLNRWCRNLPSRLNAAIAALLNCLPVPTQTGGR